MSEELTPMNHRELWLKAIATGTVPEWLEPMTHEELWLKAIAQGGGGVLVVTDTDGTLDKTWQEIKDADFAVIKVGNSTLPVYEVRKGGTTTYTVKSMKYQSGTFSLQSYTASSASNYPTVVSAGGGGND
jgi:hypothetical protein